MKTPGVLLFVLRHGQTDYNAQRRFQGQSQTTLNAEGRDQARRTGEIVANLLGDLLPNGSKIVEAVSSDLPRASETALIVSKIVNERLNAGLNFSLSTALRELNIGSFQDKTVNEIDEHQPGFMSDFCMRWEADPYGTRYPGEHGESRNMVGERLAHMVLGVNKTASNTGFVNKSDKRHPLRRAAQVFLWSAHGAVIDVLLELLQCELGGEARIIGNGDLLIFEPSLAQSKANNAKAQATQKFAARFGCTTEWNLLRHYRVGNTAAARIHKQREEDEKDQNNGT